MTIYKFSEARQKLAALLQKAVDDGKVMIRRKDGIIFELKPQLSKKSPLDVEGVDVDVRSDEILSAINEGRARKQQPKQKQTRKVAVVKAYGNVRNVANNLRLRSELSLKIRAFRLTNGFWLFI